MNDFYWLIELRKLWALLLGVFFLFPMLRVQTCRQGETMSVPSNGMIYLWMFFVALVIALTPEATMGGDKMIYTDTFYEVSSGYSSWCEFNKDVLFYGWMRFVAVFTKNPTVFFVLTAFIYIGGYVFALTQSVKVVYFTPRASHISFLVLLFCSM